MRQNWKNKLRNALDDARRTIIVVAIIAGIQIAISLLAWLVLFRRYAQGLAMGLTLVGFLSWFLSFFTSELNSRVAGARARLQAPYQPFISADEKKEHDLSKQTPDRFDLGCLIFIAGIIPLLIAFALRVHADLSAGKTWADIFPPIYTP